MPATPFDSARLSRLFPTGELSRLFSDTAEVRAMMITWGALAKAQGARGVIPETAAAAIHRASMELQIDPGGLGESVGQNAVTVPGLVAAFRTEMQAPEHAQYLHWGATSQDIQDTGLMLRLRQVLAAMEGEIGTALAGLARLAEAHAGTPMAARTYGQDATPTSFGAVVAEWGWALLSARRALARVKGHIVHEALERISPLAVPVMLEIGKEPVYGEGHESILADAEEDLIAEAMSFDRA